MKRIIKLTEADLNRIIKKVIEEQQTLRTGNFDNPEDFLPNDYLKSGTVKPTGTKSKVNPTILQAQKALHKLGYNLGNSGVGKNGVDGVNGPNTRSAISIFQRENRLPQTGIADPKTLELLNNALNKKTTSVLRPEEPKAIEKDPVKWWNDSKTSDFNNTPPVPKKTSLKPQYVAAKPQAYGGGSGVLSNYLRNKK